MHKTMLPVINRLYTLYFFQQVKLISATISPHHPGAVIMKQLAVRDWIV